jgi:hypothetical protein
LIVVQKKKIRGEGKKNGIEKEQGNKIAEVRNSDKDDGE